MGTHPIFESDFDCLTDCVREGLIFWGFCRICTKKKRGKMSDVKPESGDGGGGGESTTTVAATSVLDDLTGADSPQIQTEKLEKSEEPKEPIVAESKEKVDEETDKRVDESEEIEKETE